MESVPALLDKKEKRKVLLYTTNLSQGERHNLHILLHYIPGAKCFEDLKMSLDGILLCAFKETQ